MLDIAKHTKAHCQGGYGAILGWNGIHGIVYCRCWLSLGVAGASDGWPFLQRCCVADFWPFTQCCWCCWNLAFPPVCSSSAGAATVGICSVLLVLLVLLTSGLSPRVADAVDRWPFLSFAGAVDGPVGGWDRVVGSSGHRLGKGKEKASKRIVILACFPCVVEMGVLRVYLGESGVTPDDR